MIFNVVFMSLLAMLPSPIIFGAIIDKTCILWQEECGETTNCLLYDTIRLREVIMFTTGGIMLVGVLFDCAVCYYSKSLVIFNPEQKAAKETSSLQDEEEKVTLNKLDDQYKSTLSMSHDQFGIINQG